MVVYLDSPEISSNQISNLTPSTDQKFVFLRNHPLPSLRIACALAVMLHTAAVSGGPSLGLKTELVSEIGGANSFPLVRASNAAPLFLDSNDYPGVLRAAGDLQADIERVTGVRPNLATNLAHGAVRRDHRNPRQKFARG